MQLDIYSITWQIRKNSTIYGHSCIYGQSFFAILEKVYTCRTFQESVATVSIINTTVELGPENRLADSLEIMPELQTFTIRCFKFIDEFFSVAMMFLIPRLK